MPIIYTFFDIGCGHCWSLDDNWKLVFPHCMFPVECTIEGLGVRLPDVCPCEPLTSGSAFCAAHMQVALEKGCPTSVKEFLKFCGA